MNLRTLLLTAVLATLATTSQAAEFAPLVKRWVPLASCAISGCSEFQVITTVDMDTVPSGTLVNASVVWRSHGDTHLSSTLEYVFCSKSHPTMWNYTRNNDPKLPDWSKLSLDPGAFSNESPAAEAQYQVYYAVCHAAAPKDVFDKKLAARLGYKFSEPHYGDEPDANINPIDFMRKQEALASGGETLQSRTGAVSKLLPHLLNSTAPYGRRTLSLIRRSRRHPSFRKASRKGSLWRS